MIGTHMVGADRSPERFVQLDALRFFFAVLVVLGHTFGFNRTLVHGAYAVDFFFILSGFVLSHMLIQRPTSWGEFAWARFARLYPLHFATMAWMALQILGPRTETAPYPLSESLPLHLLLLQGTDLLGGYALNYPSWSISVEWLVNILLFYPIVRARSVPAAVICAGVSAVALVAAWGPVFDEATVQPLWPAIPVVSPALLRGSVEIPLGYLLYEIYLFLRPRIDRVHYRRLATGLEIALGGLLIYCLSSNRDVWDALAVPLSAALILQMATWPGQVSTFLQGRVFAALGNLSYSIYLLHIPLLSMAAGAGLLSVPGDHLTLLWCGYFGLLLALAWMSFRYFERPAQQNLIRLFRSWTTRIALP
jgi:peptidoglycan/LPS O-acetylase OafA/YrhL